MLDKQEFNNWCRQQDLSQAGQAIIEEIRSSNPSRRVTGARKNVCGSYPSRKMGCTIQFESHHNELARIYELEHDPCVLEYYDQPPAIELVYQSKSGHSRRILAVYLTFDEPSYRDCMMVIRICVARFGRFPQNIVVDNGKEFHSHYFEQLLASYTCTLKYRPPAHARFGSIVERLFGTANTQFIHELQGNTQIKRLHRKVTKSVSPERLAIWTLEELYSAFCEWAYSVYDQRLHPALGTSPCDAFVTGLATGGSRLHRRVAYDELFQILTLPAPDQRKRKVQPGKGVKIHNIYYWQMYSVIQKSKNQCCGFVTTLGMQELLMH